jgi:hypothetical protein
MEPRIFRFFQYIESILSNFVAGKEISAKTRAASLPPDRKETGSVISNFFPKKENFSTGIFFLFVGFVIGNLFGTFLPAIRIFFSWDGFIVLFLLFFIEFISYIRYHGKSRFFLILWNFRRPIPCVDEGIPFWGRTFQPLIPFVQNRFSKEKVSLDLEDGRSDAKIPQLRSSATTFVDGWRYPAKGYKSLNYFKIGFLLGFFIDAYKVGS